MANQNSILLESTQVPVARRVSGIQALLSRTVGVEKISTEIRKGGAVRSITFTMLIESGQESTRLPFLLKPDVDGVVRQRRRLKPNSSDLRGEQYHRIAWGQLEEWVKIQVAMIEGGQMTPVDAFLPRMIDQGGRTLGQVFLEDRLWVKALPAPESAT